MYSVRRKENTTSKGCSKRISIILFRIFSFWLSIACTIVVTLWKYVKRQSTLKSVWYMFSTIFSKIHTYLRWYKTVHLNPDILYDIKSASTKISFAWITQKMICLSMFGMQFKIKGCISKWEKLKATKIITQQLKNIIIAISLRRKGRV